MCKFAQLYACHELFLNFTRQSLDPMMVCNRRDQINHYNRNVAFKEVDIAPFKTYLLYLKNTYHWWLTIVFYVD
jgi:hypothetical protein